MLIHNGCPLTFRINNVFSLSIIAGLTLAGSGDGTLSRGDAAGNTLFVAHIPAPSVLLDFVVWRCGWIILCQWTTLLLGNLNLYTGFLRFLLFLDDDRANWILIIVWADIFVNGSNLARRLLQHCLRHRGVILIEGWTANLWDSFYFILYLMTFLNQLINNSSIRNRSSIGSPFRFRYNCLLFGCLSEALRSGRI